MDRYTGVLMVEGENTVVAGYYMPTGQFGRISTFQFEGRVTSAYMSTHNEGFVSFVRADGRPGAARIFHNDAYIFTMHYI